MAKPLVLCIDDLENDLIMRKTLLETLGCNVQLATEPRECLAALTESKIDLVLLDYHLGDGVTGEDLARDIRTCCPGVPLVMLTGDPNIPESARGSVDAVLLKGAASSADLIATLQSFLPNATW